MTASTLPSQDSVLCTLKIRLKKTALLIEINSGTESRISRPLISVNVPNGMSRRGGNICASDKAITGERTR